MVHQLFGIQCPKDFCDFGLFNSLAQAGGGGALLYDKTLPKTYRPKLLTLGHSRKKFVCKDTLAVHFDGALVTAEIRGEGAVLGKAGPTGNRTITIHDRFTVHSQHNHTSFQLFILVTRKINLQPTKGEKIYSTLDFL